VLRRLNITIKYIPSTRNKVANSLSRILFYSNDMDPTIEVYIKAFSD